MPLIFVGLGLEQSPTLYEIKVLKNSNRIYYETYTSPSVNPDPVSVLSESIGGGNKKVESVTREFVEDGRKIIDLAKNENVALVCSGDPMIATTHQGLRTRAIRGGIETKILHGSSILSALSGELGLSSYSFGRTVTITRAPIQYTAYNTVFQNLLRGLHTTLLLEWDEANKFFLAPKDAITRLIEAENDLRYGIITSDTVLFSVSELGKWTGEGQELSPKIAACNFSAYAEQDFGDPPTTLVIPGKLHFTEIEALCAIMRKPEGYFTDNSKSVRCIAEQMLTKYSQKTLNALIRARSKAEEKNRKYDAVFENVELYTQDAIRFLNEGMEELAILSMGYAEGLLDSLRFLGELDFEW